MQKKTTRKEKQLQRQNTKTPASKTLPVASSKTKRLLALLVALVAFLLYANTLQHDYTLDDYSLIKENTMTRQGTKAIPAIFKTSYRTGYINGDEDLYRPLSKAMFAIEWQLAPDKPALSHWVNVLLYALTGYLLFITLAAYFNQQLLVAFITALLFVAHPVHTEVVANIKSRDEILCFLFLISTLYFAHQYITTSLKKHLVGSGLCFFLAFLSKESAITFVIVIPLALYFFTPATISQKTKITVLLICVTVVFLFIRFRVLSGNLSPGPVSVIDNLLVAAPGFFPRAISAIAFLGLYLKLLVIPHPLVSDYSLNQLAIVTADNWRFILSFIVFAGLLIYSLIGFKVKSIFSFGILYWFITMALVSNVFFLIGTSFGERLLYAPSLGFCIVAGALLTSAFAQKQQTVLTRITDLVSGNTKLALATAAIMVLYAGKTISRNSDWKDNFTLYTQDVINSPKSARTHYYLGNHVTQTDFLNENADKKNAYIEQGLRELTIATEIYPQYADAYNQLGKVYSLKNDIANSSKNYEKAVSINPQNALYLSNYGTIFFNAGKYEEARKRFLEAIKWNPNFSDAYMNLGCTYGQLKNFDAAIAAFQKAVSTDPQNASAYYFMGLTYQFKGDEQSAQLYMNKAYAINPRLKK